MVLMCTHVYIAKGLAPAEHRIRMCQLAVVDSPFVMVDTWEVRLVPFLYYVIGLPCVFVVLLLEKADSSVGWVWFMQAKQTTYQRTHTVLSRIEMAVNNHCFSADGEWFSDYCLISYTCVHNADNENPVMCVIFILFSTTIYFRCWLSDLSCLLLVRPG